MACSGCAAVARLRLLGFWKIKRGPRGPMHTARSWMALAIPGGAPGYDDDKEFGNNITHIAARTSQRLRETYCPSLESQARATSTLKSEFSGVFGVRRERKCCLQPCKPLLRLHPGEFRQLMPEPGELPLGVMPGVGAADVCRLFQGDFALQVPDQRRHAM